jgi:RNA polymerase sigma factor (sigma-70 family)
VFAGIDRYEPGREGGLYAWLRTIAEHRVQDVIRHHGRKKRGGGRTHVSAHEVGSDDSIVDLFERVAAADPRASQMMRRDEAVHALRIAIAGLPDDQRTAVELCCLRDLSFDDAGREMSRTPDSVRGLVQRGIRALADALGRASLWLSRG